jgi:hypothetical protein
MSHFADQAILRRGKAFEKHEMAVFHSMIQTGKTEIVEIDDGKYGHQIYTHKLTYKGEVYFMVYDLQEKRFVTLLPKDHQIGYSAKVAMLNLTRHLMKKTNALSCDYRTVKFLAPIKRKTHNQG